MRRALLCAALLAWLGSASTVDAYSVLAHETAIDASWDRYIQPLLLKRFPRADKDALLQARSYAYGGSAIQDLGYYPFGNKFFSNLVHYTRSGDFVEALIRQSRTLDELAFALGALAHYANDNTGHPDAVNRAVPLIFPKLAAKYGDRVTYVQAPKEHVIVEFSFDIVQAAAGAYLPETFRKLIGFRVASPLLARAFFETYGLELSEVFADEDRAIATYRYAVSQLVPVLTEAAWRDKQDEIARLVPAAQRPGFIVRYRRADFEQEFGHDYQRAGFFARFLGWVYRIVPKVGPLKPLSFKAPTAEAEALFVNSLRTAAARFQASLVDVADGRFDIRNTDFDTGRPARHGEYALADDTYLELLQRLAKRRYENVPEALRRNILAFYGQAPQPSPASRDERKRWPAVEAALVSLRAQ